MGRQARLETRRCRPGIYRWALPSVAGSLSDSHTGATAVWWFGFHNTLSGLRLTCVLRSEGMFSYVLPCWLRGLELVGTFTRTFLPAIFSLGGASVQVGQGLRYPLTLSLTWMRCLFTWSGCWLDPLLLDAWLSPCLYRKDVITKAHTLGRRHLSLPSVGLASHHLPRLPFHPQHMGWAPQERPAPAAARRASHFPNTCLFLV